MEIHVRKLALCFFALALLDSSETAQAQSRLGLFVGASEYDLSGVDQATIVAVRVHRDLSRIAVLEFGVAHVELRQQFGRSNLYLPEVMGQLQWPLGRVAPYLGFGIGAGIDVPINTTLSTDVDATFSGAIGARISLPYNLTLSLDGRLRTFGTKFTASGSEGTIGLSYGL